MEQFMKKSLSIALLVSAMVVHAGQQPQSTASAVPSLVKIRPQSLNGARKVAGETPGVVTHLDDMEGYYSNLSIAIEGQRTFRPAEIARLLFDGFVKTAPATTASSNRCKPTCNTQTILVQGSAVADRDPKAFVAENFYLAPNFNSTLSFKPTITNVIVDFNYFAGLSNWVNGLYFRVYAPFVHTRWNLHMKEKITSAGDAALLGGRVPTLQSASSFFAGDAPAAVALPSEVPNQAGNALVLSALSLTRNPLLYHTMGTLPKDELCPKKCPQGNVRNGLADVRAEFGWDFFQGCDYHIGAYIAAAAPTGNRPDGRLLFNPLIGNGRHWELGGGLSSHWVFWRSESEVHHIGMYIDTTVTHLFKSRERRVFDLKNNPMSRYMSAAKMNASVTNQLAGGPAGSENVVPSQFANEYTPIANLTAQDVNVSIAAQVDLTAWLNYTGDMFNIDFGYNMWLQTCEKFSCASKCGPRLAKEKSTWALAGNAIPYGIDTNTLAENSFFYPLSFSASKATISSAANMTAPANNTDIDAPQPASLVNPGTANRFALNNPLTTAITQINLSNPPTFLSMADIDMKQQASSKLSHKVFANVGWKWNWENIIPSLNLGGEAEFGSGVRKCEPQPTKPNCPKMCMNSALSQWGVWVKFNVAFN